MHGLKKPFRVDEIKGIAFGNGGELQAVQAANAIVFSVVPEDIGHKGALLKQVATAGQVVGPGTGHRGPGFVPVEPLAVLEQAGSGKMIVTGLMGRIVDDEAVQAMREGQVGRPFDVFRTVGVSPALVAVGGEGFRRGDVLPEDMGH